MKVKIHDTTIDIRKNELNSKSFWNPIGMFINETYIQKDNISYKCGVRFVNKEGQDFAQIHDLMIVDERSIVRQWDKGVIHKEIPISRFKIFLIKWLSNQHPLNGKWYHLRKGIYERRNTIAVFTVSILMSLVYYFGNGLSGGQWAKYIADNPIIQTIFILLNIFSVGSVFFPFTIRKELSTEDIKKIFQAEIKAHEEYVAGGERAKRMSQIG